MWVAYANQGSGSVDQLCDERGLRLQFRKLPMQKGLGSGITFQNEWPGIDTGSLGGARDTAFYGIPMDAQQYPSLRTKSRELGGGN